METRKQQVVGISLFIVALSLIMSCANQMSPPGGDVDKIAPYVLESYPTNGSTNFRDQEVEISFSEYVNKRNMNDAFFISPIIDGFPKFSWTNKTVYIEFPDSLKSNTTYSLILGTEITDVNNNNKMKEPFILTFSTGDKIDSGRVKGKVYTKKGNDILIFAYDNDTGNVNIYINKPDYISQIDENGNFSLNGLADGRYILFAVKDDFKDLVYNIGDDLIGIPFHEVEIINNREVSDINFFVSKEDTLVPNIQTVTMTDRNHLVVEFNEPLDSSRISISNFSIVDSTENKVHDIKAWFKPNSKKNEYILILSDSLSTESEYYLNVTKIYDRYENKLKRGSSNFIVSERLDTNKITLSRIDTPYEKSLIDYLQPSFQIYFSDAFNLNNLEKLLSLYTPDSSEIPIRIETIDAAALNVTSEINLKPKTNYTLLVNLKMITDYAGNHEDTVITKSLSTISDMEFTGASGVVKSHYENVKIVLENISSKEKSIQRNLETNNSFNFDRILPGQYLLWVYNDADSNNEYSKGSVLPLYYAERFYYYPDTLKLRARWPVGDIEINF